MAVNGADAYVSADWYVSPEQVPTWLYQAVHLTGTVRTSIRRRTRSASRRAQRQVCEGWLAPKPPWTSSKMTAGRLEALKKAIVGLLMSVDDVEGSFKLNQHKSDVDHAAIADGAGPPAGGRRAGSGERNARAAAAFGRSRDDTLARYGLARRDDVMSTKKKIGILGASGYTGAELVRLLLRHPKVEIVLLTADRKAGTAARPRCFRNLRRTICPGWYRSMRSIGPQRRSMLAFCALPHGTTQKVHRGPACQGTRHQGGRPRRPTSGCTTQPRTPQWYGHEHHALELAEGSGLRP